jgi:hypothetical protein
MAQTAELAQAARQMLDRHRSNDADTHDQEAQRAVAHIERMTREATQTQPCQDIPDPCTKRFVMLGKLDRL